MNKRVLISCPDKLAIFSITLMFLAFATTLLNSSVLELPAFAQTSVKCTPDQTGVNISKSNCLSDIPTSVGENMTYNGTGSQ
jgi:hypothetical protein